MKAGVPMRCPFGEIEPLAATKLITRREKCEG